MGSRVLAPRGKGRCMVIVWFSTGQHGVRLSALQFSEKHLIGWRSGETNDECHSKQG